MNLRIKGLLSTILVLVLSFSESFGQRPPTSGPNLTSFNQDEDSFSPLLILAGGVLVGAGTYITVKHRGPKILVFEHLPTYLLNRNYLPSEDALNLMYRLNPELDSSDVIRSNKKLNLPDFPKLTSNINFQEVLSNQIDLNKTNLKNIDSKLKSLIQDFKSWEQSQPKTSDNSAFNKISSSLSSFESISPYFLIQKNEENIILVQLISDLMNALQENLEQILENKLILDENINTIKNIEINLNEINLTLDQLAWNELRHLKDDFFSPNQIIEQPSSHIHLITKREFSDNSLHSSEKISFNTSKLKKFALAVYKFDENGELITNGPEVEKRYLIKYALPALKDNPNAFHYLSGPATYAYALFPPAKLYIELEDNQGNTIPINNQIIDFKLVFNNPKLGDEDGIITVPIYASK